MENGNGNGVVGLNQKISEADVISKVKDDGDFDRLRLSIIRKLKENEELRSRIVSIVKQSEAINSPGAENMKPRQLSDAIHQEVGAKLNEQISDGLWEIIRSPQGMKSEITETVKSVYDKLSKPKRDENPDSSFPDPKRTRNDHKSNNIPSNDKVNGNVSQTVSHQIDINNPVPAYNLSMDEQQKETQQLLKNDTQDHKEAGDGSDDDPDAPPGFG